MKVMIDTIIFISAVLFPNGRASDALKKAFMPPFRPMTCEYVIDELRRKFHEKFPEKMESLESFLSSSCSVMQIVETPSNMMEKEKLVRDEKDRPILRAALSSRVDLFLTGDKDFLESEVNDPRIISVAEFLSL
jgi:putative PIN family toxin of toxin-antitoxin system